MKNIINSLFIIFILFASCENQIENIQLNETAWENASLHLPPSPLQEGKKGLGASKWMNDWSYKISEFKVYWHYSWAEHLCEVEPDNVEFVPMIWKGTFVDMLSVFSL